jgi:hypothetical protein
MPWICLLLAPLGLLQLPGLGVLKGARLRVWWSGIHHVAVGPLDVARSKDLLTNTPNWVYFGVCLGVFPVDLEALHVCGCSCRRGAAVSQVGCRVGPPW